MARPPRAWRVAAAVVALPFTAAVVVPLAIVAGDTVRRPGAACSPPASR